jgi:hypothetical protein
LRRGGERILDALLAHLAPVGWQQINLTGDYPWDADAGLGPDGFRPLRSAAIDESPSRSETTVLDETGALALKGLTQPVVAFNVPVVGGGATAIPRSK